MGNPCIDPPDGIRDICAIDRDIVADEEIFCDILLNPFAISNLLFNGPSPISHLPDLMRRFMDVWLKEGVERKMKRNRIKKGMLHIKKIREDCQSVYSLLFKSLFNDYLMPNTQI